jgi:Domain of unknown function (DUF4194)
MSNQRDWEDLASRLDGIYTVEDFETAAYRLVAEQVIYHSDRNSRVTYAILDLYEREFTKVLASLGVSLSINRQLRYAIALPRHAKAGTATVAQTLFALVLRGLYDEGVRAGGLTEDGEILCDYIELQEKFRLMTGRDLPTRGELDTLLRTVKRWGIARRLEDDDSGSLTPLQEQSAGGLAIRPAIVDVLGETALIRLAQWEAAKEEVHGDGTVGPPMAIEDNQGMTDETT